MEAVEVIPDDNIAVPQWQIDEVRIRKEYYKQHPEELIGWDDALKMLMAE